MILSTNCEIVVTQFSYSDINTDEIILFDAFLYKTKESGRKSVALLYESRY